YARSAEPTRALSFMRLAHQRAVATYSIAEARSLFDQAMALLDGLSDTTEHRRHRVGLLVGHFVVAMETVHDLPSYFDRLRRMVGVVDEIGDDALLARYYTALANCQWAVGDLHGAVGSATRAVSLAQATGQPEWAGMSHFCLESSYVVLGQYD